MLTALILFSFSSLLSLRKWPYIKASSFWVTHVWPFSLPSSFSRSLLFFLSASGHTSRLPPFKCPMYDHAHCPHPLLVLLFSFPQEVAIHQGFLLLSDPCITMLTALILFSFSSFLSLSKWPYIKASSFWVTHVCSLHTKGLRLNRADGRYRSNIPLPIRAFKLPARLQVSCFHSWNGLPGDWTQGLPLSGCDTITSWALGLYGLRVGICQKPPPVSPLVLWSYVLYGLMDALSLSPLPLFLCLVGLVCLWLICYFLSLSLLGGPCVVLVFSGVSVLQCFTPCHLFLLSFFAWWALCAFGWSGIFFGASFWVDRLCAAMLYGAVASWMRSPCHRFLLFCFFCFLCLMKPPCLWLAW